MAFTPANPFMDAGSLIHHARSWSTITSARKKWRIVRAALYSLRALHSIVRRKSPLITAASPQQSHAIDIELPEVVTSSDSDPACLITQIVREKSLDSLCKAGGVEGLASALGSHIQNGIPGDENDLSSRRERYGSNIYTTWPASKGLIYFAWNALMPRNLSSIVLLISAALALGCGMIERRPKQGLYEGGAIFTAFVLVAATTAISDFKLNRRLSKPPETREELYVVVRGGSRRTVYSSNVVVGDILNLPETGKQIPADGLFIGGNSVRIDESSITGESDHIDVDSTSNPFLLSGSKLADGYGQMLVTSVGMNTRRGEMVASANGSFMAKECGNVQDQVNELQSRIGKWGLVVSFGVVVVLFVWFFTGDEDSRGSGGETGFRSTLNWVIPVIYSSITIGVVAIPFGLPSIVRLTLAYSMKWMMAHQSMVRKPSACTAVGSTTAICTDKTGILTLSQMEVAKCFVGEQVAYSWISPGVLDLLCLGVVFNTTASVSVPYPSAKPKISGSLSEVAVLSWVVGMVGYPMHKVKREWSLLQEESFNSSGKYRGILMKKKSDGAFHLHWKGEAEIILAMCTSYYTIEGSRMGMDEDARRRFELEVGSMAASGLHCIAFAHRHIPEEDLENVNTQLKLKEEDLTLLGIIGLRESCKPMVEDAVKSCKNSGVEIKMITGDNILTAKAIAKECGILEVEDHEGEIVEGVDFQNYSPQERLQRVDKIRVMARSSPNHKLLMVQCLKQKGHTVAFIGAATSDQSALQEADIGISMSTQATEIAKESSDVVILDDDFSTVITVLMWSKLVLNHVDKLIQIQITANLVAVVINTVTLLSDGEVPLKASRLLCIDIIISLFAALALVKRRPTEELTVNLPVRRKKTVMWRNLLLQTPYQIAVLLTLQFKYESILHVSKGVKDTMIFNTLALCQVFSTISVPGIWRRRAIVKVLNDNLYSVFLASPSTFLQFVMVEFLKKCEDMERLNELQWIVCFCIAAVTCLINILAELIPVPERPFLVRESTSL